MKRFATALSALVLMTGTAWANLGPLVTAADLSGALRTDPPVILDIRAPRAAEGKPNVETYTAGHIPGAQCAVFTDNLGSDGRFLPAEALRERFDDLRGERPVDNLVAYCGSGVTACHNLFAMSLAGYPLIPLYAGSWSEWITDPARPIATGD